MALIVLWEVDSFFLGGGGGSNFPYTAPLNETLTGVVFE